MRCECGYWERIERGGVGVCVERGVGRGVGRDVGVVGWKGGVARGGVSGKVLGEELRGVVRVWV